MAKISTIWKIAPVFLFVILLVVVGVGKNTINGDSDENIDAMVDDLTGKCNMTDNEILAEGLTNQEIQKVRDFCNLSNKEMKKLLKDKFKIAKNLKNNESLVLEYTNSYSCLYEGLNWGIPNYADLGLSSSTCSWHDNTPISCKIEGRIACLWGCTNIDPNLVWHEKTFTNQLYLEREIYSKGYHRTAGYAAGEIWRDYADSDYTRGITYGYRYQVMWHNNTRTAENEGPEANPESNWYGYVHGYWPVEVFVWHHNC